MVRRIEGVIPHHVRRFVTELRGFYSANIWREVLKYPGGLKNPGGPSRAPGLPACRRLSERTAGVFPLINTRNATPNLMTGALKIARSLSRPRPTVTPTRTGVGEKDGPGRQLETNNIRLRCQVAKFRVPRPRPRPRPPPARPRPGARARSRPASAAGTPASHRLAPPQTPPLLPGGKACGGGGGPGFATTAPLLGLGRSTRVGLAARGGLGPTADGRDP
jgi:hypothetical protein